MAIEVANQRLIGLDGAIMLAWLGKEVVGAAGKTFATLDVAAEGGLPEWDVDTANWVAAGSGEERELSAIMSPKPGAGWWMVTGKAAPSSAFPDEVSVGELLWVPAGAAGVAVTEAEDKMRRVRWAKLEGGRSVDYAPSEETVDTTAAGEKPSARTVETSRQLTVTGIWDMRLTVLQRAGGMKFKIFSGAGAAVASADAASDDALGKAVSDDPDASRLNVIVARQRETVTGVERWIEPYWGVTLGGSFPRNYQYGNALQELTVTMQFSPSTYLQDVIYGVK